MLKTNGTELIDDSADVCLHFSGHVTSPAFGRVLSFCWNPRCVCILILVHFLCVTATKQWAREPANETKYLKTHCNLFNIKTRNNYKGNF